MQAIFIDNLSANIANHNCTDIPNQGTYFYPKRKCSSNTGFMWYVAAQKIPYCKMLFYKGCGGNNNRFCSELECVKTCRPLFYKGFEDEREDY